jgi:hypothetical protein
MSNEKQQTAVEWLLDRIEDVDLTEKLWENIKHQAKEKEKEKRSIELPSDEEINAEFTLDSCDNDQGVMWGLRKGAIWMRDKIQGGNK